MKDDIFYRSLFRFSADTALFFSVLFFPWWISVVLAILGAAYFSNFIEAFFAGLLIDALYGTSGSSIFGIHLFFSFAFLALWFLVDFARHKLRIL
jgi:hypothetical protein